MSSYVALYGRYRSIKTLGLSSNLIGRHCPGTEQSDAVLVDIVQVSDVLLLPRMEVAKLPVSAGRNLFNLAFSARLNVTQFFGAERDAVHDFLDCLVDLCAIEVRVTVLAGIRATTAVVDDPFLGVRRVETPA